MRQANRDHVSYKVFERSQHDRHNNRPTAEHASNHSTYRLRVLSDRTPRHRRATGIGYRAFDTATYYGNEKAAGQAIRDAGLNPQMSSSPPSCVLGTWDTQKPGKRLRLPVASSVRTSLTFTLLTGHIKISGLIEGTWRALERLLDRGSVGAIGVSNFDASDLGTLPQHSRIVPAVNQIELNPLRQRKGLLAESLPVYSHHRLGAAGQGRPVLTNFPPWWARTPGHRRANRAALLLQKQVVTTLGSANLT